MIATSPARGFTLIELLVVVAIIGMLSSIVLSSLTTARNKAGDSSVRSNLKSLTNLTALYQSNNGSYGPSLTAATCPTTSGTSMFYTNASIREAIAKAAMAGGGATRCATDGNNYAISVQLKTTTDHWCVDSTGGVRQTSNASWTGVACP